MITTFVTITALAAALVAAPQTSATRPCREVVKDWMRLLFEADPPDDARRRLEGGIHATSAAACRAGDEKPESMPGVTRHAGDGQPGGTPGATHHAGDGQLEGAPGVTRRGTALGAGGSAVPAPGTGTTDEIGEVTEIGEIGKDGEAGRSDEGGEAGREPRSAGRLSGRRIVVTRRPETPSSSPFGQGGSPPRQGGSPSGRGRSLAGQGGPASPGRTAVAAALRQVGRPYVWGGGSGAGPTGGGFDCSGLALHAWSKAGARLTHYTGSQFRQGRRVSFSQLSPGDLVFFGGGSGDPTHVGVYVKNGVMVHAPKTGDVVRTTNFTASPYYRARYRGAVRPSPGTLPG
ncbi:C40 family peptidase [Streptosporangium carneum]|uniref:NlpC/P60 domain-containing protein n=1 Tax=Streptosporangium carneum TaxID=47481 RepID=A0A9W6HXR9_9ACTN|nr:C40 family peptidase [Streptosporangium carneum]GLK08236.1 hypothetical protein GCM10017600_16410 [Streptosporangium carneum]